MKAVIRNKGELPVVMLTHLGISTSRDDASKIGQFGSGAKHGVLVALRAGLEITIFSGTTRITPKFLPLEGTTQEELVFEIDRKGVVEVKHTSMTKGFGDIDWSTDTDLALREFIANALDQGESIKSSFYFTDDKVTGITGQTLIVIEASPQVMAFFTNISHWFTSAPVGVMTEHTIKRGSCYLKGVFVGEVNDAKTALFNYHFSDLPLNESRRVDSSILSSRYGNLLADSEEALVCLFQTVQRDSFERNNLYYFRLDFTPEQCANIINAWRRVHGALHPCPQGQVQVMIERKIPFLAVPLNIYEILSRKEIDLQYKMANDERARFKFHNATPDMIRLCERAWHIMTDVGLTSKPFPSIKSFTEMIKDDKHTMGFCDDSTVYFNIDDTPSMRTVLEELLHYESDTKDFTREFQEAAFQLMARLANRITI